MTRTVAIEVMTTPDLKAAIRVQAAKAGMSMSTYLHHLMQKDLEQTGEPEAA